MEWYAALSPVGYGLALYPGTCCFVTVAVLCVCLFVYVCVDRSDTSFICFELSVDYLCAVQPSTVLARTDWKVGVVPGR